MLFRRTRWFAPPQFRWDDGDEAVAGDLGTLVLAMRREQLLAYLPARARVAEIGVARGDFSRRIIAIADPSYLALIDAWEEQSPAVYTQDNNNVGSDAQTRRYRDVKRRFERSGTTRTRRVIRGYSNIAVNTFEDGFFDWVYVDANHSYAACLEDLRLWAPKVKSDGFICGHDFAHHASARARFGVVEAVFGFLEQTGSHLLAITTEHFPTFVIAKDRTSANARRFLDLLFTFEAHLVSVPQESVRDFRHARILDSGQRRASLMHFRS